MARTSATLTLQESAAYEKFCIDHGIILDGEPGMENGDILGGFIVTSMQCDITQETLDLAYPQVKSKLHHKSAAQQTLDKVIQQSDPAVVSAFNQWFYHSQSELVNTGDQGTINAAALLLELRGRQFSTENAYAAIGRLQHKLGVRIYWAETGKKLDSKSWAHSHQPGAESTQLNPKDEVNLPMWKRRSHTQRQTEQTAQGAAPTPQAPSKSLDSWQQVVEMLARHGSHGQQARWEQIIEQQRSQGKQWSEVYSVLNAEQKKLQLMR